MARSRRAKPQDIHDIAVAMPGAETYDAPSETLSTRCGRNRLCTFETLDPTQSIPQLGSDSRTSWCCGSNPKRKNRHWSRIQPRPSSPLPISTAMQPSLCKRAASANSRETNLPRPSQTRGSPEPRNAWRPRGWPNTRPQPHRTEVGSVMVPRRLEMTQRRGMGSENERSNAGVGPCRA